MAVYKAVIVRQGWTVLGVEVNAVSEKHAREKIHRHEWTKEEFVDAGESGEPDKFGIDSGVVIKGIAEGELSPIKKEK